MPANTTGIRTGYLAGKYEHAPSKLGHLFSPGSQVGPHAFMPYALDNGAYGAFTNQIEWESGPWTKLLRWALASGQRPSWTLVPDAVGDRERTLRMWHRYASVARAVRAPLAFAAQDGMTFADVPRDAEVVFLGGSTEWKWSNLFAWCAHFPRVHVGRVNGLRGLRLCAKAGAESCDGTGFSRATRQWRELETFLAEMNGELVTGTQECMSFDGSSDETEPGLR